MEVVEADSENDEEMQKQSPSWAEITERSIELKTSLKKVNITINQNEKCFTLHGRARTKININRVSPDIVAYVLINDYDCNSFEEIHIQGNNLYINLTNEEDYDRLNASGINVNGLYLQLHPRQPRYYTVSVFGAPLGITELQLTNIYKEYGKIARVEKNYGKIKRKDGEIKLFFKGIYLVRFERIDIFPPKYFMINNNIVTNIHDNNQTRKAEKQEEPQVEKEKETQRESQKKQQQQKTQREPQVKKQTFTKERSKTPTDVRIKEKINNYDFEIKETKGIPEKNSLEDELEISSDTDDESIFSPTITKETKPKKETEEKLSQPIIRLDKDKVENVKSIIKRQDSLSKKRRGSPLKENKEKKLDTQQNSPNKTEKLKENVMNVMHGMKNKFKKKEKFLSASENLSKDSLEEKLKYIDHFIPAMHLTEKDSQEKYPKNISEFIKLIEYNDGFFKNFGTEAFYKTFDSDEMYKDFLATVYATITPYERYIQIKQDLPPELVYQINTYSGPYNEDLKSTVNKLRILWTKLSQNYTLKTEMNKNLYVERYFYKLTTEL